MVKEGGRQSHDVEKVIEAVTTKLRAKASILNAADDHFSLEIYRKGLGYDVKLKTTT
jgi:hypothetical protein